MMTDFYLHLKLPIKKAVGSYLTRYKPAKEMHSYLQKVIPPFMHERLADQAADKRLLIASMGWYDAKTEAIYAKTLEAIGYETHVITGYDPYVAEIFKIYGINKIYFYEDFTKKFSLGKMKVEAMHLLKSTDKRDILNLEKNGIQVGKFAAANFMRATRESSLDLKDEAKKSAFVENLTYSLNAASAMELVLKEVEPDLVYLIDRGYTPVGQLFDACLKGGIPVITRNASHKSGWELLKRYSSPEMWLIHYSTLSKDSWKYVKEMTWNDDRWQGLYNELARTYSNGDWYAEVGTQINKKLYSKRDLLSELQLDLNKKTAVIFPHMFWDATFFWGKDLFEDYYDWFVNVLKVAEKNTNLNWIIKIHPANIVKANRDNYRGEHKELMAVYETFGQLPDHVRVIPPESGINTFSLFQIMDYCLTVRGTIGIEASLMGINTFTAGTGRYDHLGFTHDFESKEDYIHCIRSLEKIPQMTEEAIELARRFAYGIFILRPIRLDLLEHGYKQDQKCTMIFRPLFASREEFETSSFVRDFRSFVISDKEDFLNYNNEHQ